jgi:hypothetical protein
MSAGPIRAGQAQIELTLGRIKANTGELRRQLADITARAAPPDRPTIAQAIHHRLAATTQAITPAPINHAIATLSSALASLATPAGLATTALAGLAASLALLARHTAHWQDAIIKAARRLGTTPTELATLDLAAQFAAVPEDMARMAAAKLRAKLATATTDPDTAALFQRLGINAADLLGKPILQQLHTVAEATRRLAPEDRIRAQIDLFGRAGATLETLLDPATLQQAQDVAARRNIRITPEQAAAVERFNDALVELAYTWKFALAQAITPETLDLLRDGILALADLLTWLGRTLFSTLANLARTIQWFRGRLGLRIDTTPMRRALDSIALAAEHATPAIQRLADQIERLRPKPAERGTPEAAEIMANSRAIATELAAIRRALLDADIALATID